MIFINRSEDRESEDELFDSSLKNIPLSIEYSYSKTQTGNVPMSRAADVDAVRLYGLPL
jgi:hypothetical protein